MLTVVLSNYNHAHYLPLALEAILSQTRPADEIIIFDDASTDNSVSVIEPFLSRHSNIRLIKNKRNRGVLCNMNRGLELARGTYFFHAAADDITFPTLFEESTRLLDQFPQACLFSSRCEIIDADGHSMGVFASPMPLQSPGYIAPCEVGPFLMADDSWFNGVTTVWRRQLLHDEGGFPTDLGSFSDSYTSRLLALKHGACFSPAVLSAWRRTEGGMAWSAATDLNKAKLTARDVAHRMAQDGTFPADYPRVWSNRHIFGARRFILVQERKKARANGLMPWLLALTKEAWLSGWLFLTLRPADFLAVLKRRGRAALTRR